MRVLACALVLWFAQALGARAEPGIDVAHELRGVVLGRKVAALADPTGRLGIEQISSPAYAAKFEAPTRDVPAFGFTRDTLWLRLAVQNSGSSQRAWLMELDFPQLDYVTLYVPRDDGGFDARQVGDRLPFERRDLAYRTFIFSLEEPAHGARVYYLSVRTSGMLALPLTAWTVMEFMEHQHLDWAGLCVFYGVILVMSCYSACLFLFTRDRRFLAFAGLVLAAGLFQLCYVGHSTQLLGAHIELAQVATPLAGALWMVAAVRVARHQFLPGLPHRHARLCFELAHGWTLVLVALAAFTPVRVSLRLIVLSLVLQAPITLWLLARAARTRSVGARLIVLGWAALNVGALTMVLKVAGVTSTDLLSQWGMQMGASLQFILIATAHACQLNELRATLAGLNGELEGRIVELGDAVARAKRAHALAAQATRVKDEFLATMSHELRTPLNAIINIPQGLVLEFPLDERVLCGACKSQFELEEDERFDADAPCPECAAHGQLAVRSVVRYFGTPRQTLRYIEKLERSGKHLLKVVHGILDADRRALDRTELAREMLDPRELARDVVEDLAPLGERSGVRVTLEASPSVIPHALDPLRMRQVLINLVGNAIKFSNGHGTVVVRVETSRDACSFTVRDQGVGIPEDRMDDVFDSYTQVHGQAHFGGTGLGLSISRALVRAHGGELSVESELGRGSSFTCRIPRRASLASVEHRG